MCQQSKNVELGCDMPEESRDLVYSALELRDDLGIKTASMFEGIELVLGEHKCPPHIINLLKDQFMTHLRGIEDLKFLENEDKFFTQQETWYFKVSAEKVWLEEVKYFLAYPMAKFLRNDPPKPPLGGGFKPSGKVRKWFKARLSAFNKKNVHLWYSFLQAKRACDPLSEDLVPVLYEEHLEALTSKDPCLNFKNREVANKILSNPTLDVVLELIRHDLEAKFLNKDIRKEFLDCPLNDHACFESKRSSGGKVGSLRKLANLKTTYLSEKKGWDCPSLSVLHSMDYLPHKYISRGKYLHGSVNEKRYNAEDDEWDTLSQIPLSFLTQDTLENDKWSRTYHKYVESADLEGRIPISFKEYSDIRPEPEINLVETGSHLKCEIRGVLEPLKCRIISKGESLPYAICKPIQEKLFESLKEFPCFRLIGRKFDPTMLYDLVAKEVKDPHWLSIDYKAATDNLSWYLSEQIFRNLFQNFPSDLYEVAYKVLGPHDLYYPLPQGKGREYRGRQTNGQLMGSILSFPFLCLANLGVYLESSKSFNSGWTHLEKLNHVLVNGDDMLYVAPKEIYKHHASISQAVGLSLSVGKAYVHSKYANINSTSILYDLNKVEKQIQVDYYRVVLDEDIHGRDYDEVVKVKRSLYGKGTCSPVQVDFLNVGLCLNKHKVQSITDEDELKGNSGMSRYEIEQEKVGKWISDAIFHGDLHEGSSQSDVQNYVSGCYLTEEKFTPFGGRISNLYAQSHTHEDSRSGVTENIPLILEGCFDENSRKSILKWVLNHHKDEIKRQTTFPFTDVTTGKIFLSQRNLFLPVQLGGMGISPPIGFRYRITACQVALVRKLFESFTYSVRPINGFEGSKILDTFVPAYSKPCTIYEPTLVRGVCGSRRFLKKTYLRSFRDPIRVFEVPCLF